MAQVLQGLTQLDISRHGPTSVEPWLCHLIRLECICLNGKRLTSVPPGFNALTTLRSDSLFHNRVAAVPPFGVALHAHVPFGAAGKPNFGPPHGR